MKKNEFLSQGLDGILREYFAHPPGLIRFWQKGDCTREQMQIWLKHFYHFAISFPRWLANVAGICPHQEVRKILIRNMWDEEVKDARAGECHVDLLIRMGKALGLTREEIVTTPPLPTTIVALNTWENLTRNRSWLEGLAALQILERMNDPDTAERLGYPAQLNPRVWEGLHLSHEDSAFLWVHREADKAHAGGEAAYLFKYAVTRQDQENILQVSRESAVAMRIYQDGIYQAILKETAAEAA